MAHGPHSDTHPDHPTAPDATAAPVAPVATGAVDPADVSSSGAENGPGATSTLAAPEAGNLAARSLGARLTSWLTRASGRNRRLALTGTAAAFVVLVVVLVVWLRPDSAPAPTPTPEPGKTTAGPAVQAPADGDLTVHGVTVTQLAGTCEDAGPCSYVYPDQHPIVKVPAGLETVKMAAQKSAAFSVSIYALDNPARSSKVAVAAADGQLLLERVPAGKYRVTVTGDAGGVWQFDLHRTR